MLQDAQAGLGRAYIDALPFIRGKYVLMGDADCTYDFRVLGAVRREVPGGLRVRDGPRFRGSSNRARCRRCTATSARPSRPGSSTVVYSSRFSDIHCGMRGITREALERMDLRSQSWEYASEMVLKSVHMGFETDGGARPVPQGPRRTGEPPPAGGMVLAMAGGVDQPACDVRLRRRLLRLQARLRARSCSGCC